MYSKNKSKFVHYTTHYILFYECINNIYLIIWQNYLSEFIVFIDRSIIIIGTYFNFDKTYEV